MHKHKYNAKKVVTEDGTFDSKKEYQRWLELKWMQENGAINNLARQVAYQLLPKQELIEPYIPQGKTKMRKCENAVMYIADFVYERDGKLVVEDVKGLRLPEYVLKRKLMLYRFGIQIKEV